VAISSCAPAAASVTVIMMRSLPVVSLSSARLGAAHWQGCQATTGTYEPELPPSLATGNGAAFDPGCGIPAHWQCQWPTAAAAARRAVRTASLSGTFNIFIRLGGGHSGWQTCPELEA
jgi:hypothetical protein